MKMDLSQDVVIVPPGTIFYHGTGESFDSRKTRPGGYDKIFWTTQSLRIARYYIPVSVGVTMTSPENIVRGRHEREDNTFRKIGGPANFEDIAWNVVRRNREIIDPLWKKKTELDKLRYDDISEGDIKEYHRVEAELEKYKNKSTTIDDLATKWVIRQLKKMRYEVTDKWSMVRLKSGSVAGKSVIFPADYRLQGRVFQATPNREMRFFNYAKDLEPDLTDLQYHDLDVFEVIEKERYDGIIINDFAQSEYWGNYGHLSFGFFKNSMKDVTIKVLHGQTHPQNERKKRLHNLLYNFKFLTVVLPIIS